MQKSCGGFIALLLVVAIMLSLPNSADYGYESPQTVCGDSLSQSETHEDSESGSNFIAVVIFVIIVIFIIYCITGSDNQSHERR